MSQSVRLCVVFVDARIDEHTHTHTIEERVLRGYNLVRSVTREHKSHPQTSRAPIVVIRNGVDGSQHKQELSKKSPAFS